MLLSRAPAGVRLNEHLEHDDGPFVFHHACKLGLEGIVSKRKDLALQLRPLGVLDQIEESERTCGEEGSRGGLETIKRANRDRCLCRLSTAVPSFSQATAICWKRALVSSSAASFA